MKKLFYFQVMVTTIFFWSCQSDNGSFRKISKSEYIDKMKGAWIGQMAGVGWGQPTEFKWIDSYIPADKVPAWEPEMVNQHGNDDIYVEMTFLASLEKYGPDVSIRHAGIDFANSEYPLWAANRAGRENLRSGIAPPESSHPQFTDHCDDIDYQIESDYSGILAPGMPSVPIALGEKFGRLMNYGDGLYGGQFMGSMYSAAFFEKNIEKVITKGLESIPSESMYARCIRDVIRWYRENPGDWTKTWQHIEDQYRTSMEYQKFAAERKSVYIPIDSKINGAYVVMGLLYGKGNMDSTIVIAMRGGKDSDCNPSNAGGVLGAILGYQNIPARFRDSLDINRDFLYSRYNFNSLMTVCENLTELYITRNGGKIEKDDNGNTWYEIPEIIPQPSVFTASYQPGPFDASNRFSEEEMKEIRAYPASAFDPVAKQLDIKMEVTGCGKDVTPGLIKWEGKNKVFTTCPMSNNGKVTLHLTPALPDKINGKIFLVIYAGHDKGSSWKLTVMKSWQKIIDQEIPDIVDGKTWTEIKIDLSDWIGKQPGDLQVSAENIDGKPAVNYWAGFVIED